MFFAVKKQSPLLAKKQKGRKGRKGAREVAPFKSADFTGVLKGATVKRGESMESTVKSGILKGAEGVSLKGEVNFPPLLDGEELLLWG